jgi:small-conductance mechanosensitive channel
MNQAAQELTNKKHALIEHAQHARTEHKENVTRYYTQSERFTLVVAAVAVGELALLALLFDYMAVLNFLVTRAALWTLLAVIVIAMSRLMHGWVFVSMRRVQTAKTMASRAAKRIRAIEKYEGGVIDEDGIRLLYQEDHVQREPRLLSVTEIVDWVLYTLILLATVLIALTFV